MDAGQTSVEIETLDLAQIAQVVAAQIEEPAREKRMEVACAAQGEMLARGDQTMLTQALLNLAENAVKYGREGGHVRVGASVDAAGARLWVQDDGPGIVQQDLPRIFDRFYQGDASRSAGGAGLGLSLVQLIARLHGGSVEVESAPGKGSRFTIVLPREEENA